MIGKEIGDIKIEKLLGKGGMGSVYLGHQRSLGRKVAIKMITPQGNLDGQFSARFLREAQIAAGLSHPNIIQIFQIGEFEGQRYMVMEYVKGTTLQGMIYEQGGLPLKTAVDIILQAAKGLAEAHRQGVLHRDIKPENIFIDQNGNVKLADFGLAKMDTQVGLTQTGFMLGTPYYMSPEQVEAEDLDGRSDAYSLGLTFFCSLVGKPPFSGKSTVQVLYKQVNEPLSFPSEVKGAIHPKAVEVIEKMTAKNRDDRYADTDQVVVALQDLWKILELGAFGGEVGRNGPSSLAGQISNQEEGKPTLLEPSPGFPDGYEEMPTLLEPFPGGAGVSEEKPFLSDTAPGGFSGVYEEMPTLIHQPSSAFSPPKDEEEMPPLPFSLPKVEEAPPSPPKEMTREESILNEFKSLLEKGRVAPSQPKQLPLLEIPREKEEEPSLVIDWAYLVRELERIFSSHQNPEEFRLLTPQKDYLRGQQVPLSIISKERRFFQALWIDAEGLCLFEDLVGSTPEVKGHLCANVSLGINPGRVLIFGISSAEKLDFSTRKILKGQVTPDNAKVRNSIMNLLSYLKEQVASRRTFLYEVEVVVR